MVFSDRKQNNIGRAISSVRNICIITKHTILLSSYTVIRRETDGGKDKRGRTLVKRMDDQRNSIAAANC